jgi:hypothetical protein
VISIIICSVNPDYLKAAMQNISDTIGVEHEVIAIDNRKQGEGICKVYNDGAARSKYDFLCFIHEDVIIHTKDWGKRLAELLSDQNIGLVGVSGAVYKSKYPGTWASCKKSLYRTYSIQRFADQEEPVVSYSNPGGTPYSPVLVIDGVFMATRKNVFRRFQFDENTFTGFHAYDLDYSLQVGRSYKVMVSFDILLEHFSSGHLNKEWLEASALLHQKWKKTLPASSEVVDKRDASLSDFLACALVVMISVRYHGSKLSVLGNYLKLMTVFFRFNRFRHSKTVVKYLLSN